MGTWSCGKSLRNHGWSQSNGDCRLWHLAIPPLTCFAPLESFAAADVLTSPEPPDKSSPRKPSSQVFSRSKIGFVAAAALSLAAPPTEASNRPTEERTGFGRRMYLMAGLGIPTLVSLGCGRGTSRVRPGGSGAQGEPLSAQEIAEYRRVLATNRQSTTRQITQLEEGLKEPKAHIAKHIDRFGPIDKPAIQIKPGFAERQPNVANFPFTDPVKDNAYRTTVRNLYSRTQHLADDIRRLSEGRWVLDEHVNIDTLLPAWQTLQRRTRRIKPSYMWRKEAESEIATPQWEHWTIKTPADLVGLAAWCANTEMQILDRNISAFDVLHRESCLAILAEHPNLHLFDQTTPHQAMQLIRPVLNAALTNFPEPHLDSELFVVHPTKDELRAAADNARVAMHAAAFHTTPDGTIHLLKGPRHEQVRVVSHELGHVLGRQSEAVYIARVAQVEEALRLLQEIHQTDLLIEKDLDALGATRNDRERRVISDRIRDRVQKANRLNQLAKASVSGSGLVELAELFGSPHARVEETVADLVQRLVLAGLTQRNGPLEAVAEPLWQLAQFHRQASEDAGHFGSYRYADELVQRHGSAAEALRVVGSAHSHEEIAPHSARIDALNEHNGIKRIGPLTDGLSGALEYLGASEAYTNERRRRDAAFREATGSFDDGKTMAEKNRSTRAHLAEIESRIRSVQEANAALFSDYLDRVYSD